MNNSNPPNTSLETIIAKDTRMISLASSVSYGVALLAVTTYVSNLATDLYFSLKYSDNSIPGHSFFSELVLFSAFVATVAGKYLSEHAQNLRAAKLAQLMLKSDKI